MKLSGQSTLLKSDLCPRGWAPGARVASVDRKLGTREIIKSPSRVSGGDKCGFLCALAWFGYVCLDCWKVLF